MTKKILAWVIAAAMVLTMMPSIALTASAAKDEHGCGNKADCLVCTVAEMINELPEAEDIDVYNAAAVVEQIHAIDRIKGELTDDEYEELLDLVAIKAPDSGFGMDVPKLYDEAVDKVNSLNAGGTLIAEKKYSAEAGGVEFDLFESDATVKIESMDTQSEFEPLSITLGDISMYGGPMGSPLKDSYTVEENGWSNKYILPAGTYKITEIGYHAITEDGEEVATTATYSVDGEETTDYAIVEVKAGEESIVTVSNFHDPQVVVSVVDEDTGEPVEGVVIELGNVKLTSEQDPVGCKHSELGEMDYDEEYTSFGLAVMNVPDGYFFPDLSIDDSTRDTGIDVYKTGEIKLDEVANPANISLTVEGETASKITIKVKG